MEGEGWRVARFPARAVVENREGVWFAIKALIDEVRRPLSLPLPLAGERNKIEEGASHVPLPRQGERLGEGVTKGGHASWKR